MRVQPSEPAYLPQLLELVNLHLGAVVPGWALSGAFLAEHLERDRTEPLTDPWVQERATLCAVDGGGRLLAAAHLLRYGEGRGVAGGYRGAGEITWLVALPGRGYRGNVGGEEAPGKLEGKEGIRLDFLSPDRPDDRGARELAARRGHPGGRRLPAGFTAPPRGALYGGRLDGVPAPTGEPPVAGLTVLQTAGPHGTRFSAVAGDEEVGFCEVVPDLTRGGLLPALAG